MPINTIPEAIEAIRQGGIVIVVDDEDRENEGDFIMAAEKCTPEKMNLFIRYGSGYVCAPTTPQRLGELEIPMMVGQNTSRLGTAMTVTVDAKVGTTTGVSASDRSTTVLGLANRSSRPSDFTRPGHIVPLRAEPGGVLKRAGHTEATVDLCVMAGLQPVGVLAEVMNDDGTMARMPELLKSAEQFGFPIISISDLIAWRRRHERLIHRVASIDLPTQRYGTLRVHAYESSLDSLSGLAIVKGDVSDGEPALVRVHSSCITGDLLSSLRCDCGDQLHMALQRITDEGRGALIYLEQEGRGIGLVNKMKAYALQDKGLDTVQANEKLGFKPDLRDYGIGAQIMLDLGLKKLRFMTNNPAKVKGIEGFGLEINEWISIEAPANEHNKNYLRTKQEKMGHIFSETDYPPEGIEYKED